jgi:hypothetical protein
MTTYTVSLRLAEPSPGDPAVRNAWGTILNENQVLLESAITDTAVVSIAGLSTYTLTTANGAVDQARPLVQSYTGALTGNCTVTLPNVPKIGYAQNLTTGGFNVILTTGVGATATIPPDGQWYLFSADGTTDVILVPVGLGSAVTVGGLLTAKGGFTAGAQVITNTITLTTEIFGQLIELQGSSPYTVTLPTPVGNPGGFRVLFGSVPTVTFATPAGAFFGPTGNSTASIALSPAIAGTYLFESDGGNWIITALPNVSVAGTLTVVAINTTGGGTPPGVQFGDMKHSALGIEGGGWRLCYGQARPQTDPFWVFMVANGLTGSWRPGFTGSSTYNMPDARDVVLAGLDNMGGADRGLLTTGVAGFDPTILLNVGGNQNLQSHAHGASDAGHQHGDLGHGHADAGHGHADAGHTHSFSTGSVSVAPGGSTINIPGGGSTQATNYGNANIQTGFATIEVGYANIGTGFAAITVAANGAGGSQNVQPTMISAVLMYCGA